MIQKSLESGNVNTVFANSALTLDVHMCQDASPTVQADDFKSFSDAALADFRSVESYRPSFCQCLRNLHYQRGLTHAREAGNQQICFHNSMYDNLRISHNIIILIYSRKKRTVVHFYLMQPPSDSGQARMTAVCQLSESIEDIGLRSSDFSRFGGNGIEEPGADDFHQAVFYAPAQIGTSPLRR